MNARRVDPRRPAVLRENGVRRVLAAADMPAGAASSRVQTPAMPAEALPLRTSERAERHFMVVVRSDRGSLDRHSRQAVAAAALLADARTAVAAVIFGKLDEDMARLGADEFVVLPGDLEQGFEPERELECLGVLLARWRPELVLLPDAEDGSGDIGRRLAAARDLTVAGSVVEIDADSVVCFRNARSELARRSRTTVVLLAPDVADTTLPWVGRGASVEFDGQDAEPAPARRLRDLGCEPIAVQDLPLTEADLVIGAGHGVRDVAVLQTLATQLGAALGASRMVVDDGRLPRSRQIGATGHTISASLYLAFGISGAIQHLQGIRDCRRVVAVNLDASAPLVQRADLAIIADADATARQLLRLMDAPA